MYNTTHPEKNGGGRLSENWETILADPSDGGNAPDIKSGIISLVFQGKHPPLELVVNEYLIDIWHLDVFITDIHNAGNSPQLTSYPYANGTWLVYLQHEYQDDRQIQLFKERVRALLKVLY